MTKIYFGCDLIPRHWERYFRQCNALEINLEELENPPRIDTLNRWRVESPKGFAFMLHVDPVVEQSLIQASRTGAKKLPTTLKDAWERTMDNAQALAAKALVMQTPVQFHPGTNSRRVLDLFAEEYLQDIQKPIIWEAQGPWETKPTREWAAERGFAFAFDPLLAIRDEIGFHHGDGAFILSERAGLRRDFDSYDLRALVDRLKPYNRAFFLLRGRFQWEYAQAFAELLEHD